MYGIVLVFSTARTEEKMSTRESQSPMAFYQSWHTRQTIQEEGKGAMGIRERADLVVRGCGVTGSIPVHPPKSVETSSYRLRIMSFWEQRIT
jgi:hypothetical protein